ncbi:MAG TPA: SH3 domain-containing protein [Caulobacteraceae bacterium]
MPNGSATRRSSAIPIAAVIAGLVLIALIAFLLVGHPAQLFAKPVKEFAARDLQVRSSMDPVTSTVLGHLQRGDAISGKWVTTSGGHAKWLKISWPGQGDGYIWGRDLSDRARPELASTGLGSQVVAVSSVVYGEPDQKAAVVDDLSQGESVPTVGATSDGWTEISLNAGGVGYVKSAVFQSVPAADAGTDVAAADQSPAPSATPGGITHYTCTFAPEESVNPPPNTGQLSFYLDEGRACINHRYAYFADGTGGLKRVMLNDKVRRASLLYFMPDRKAFYRTDFTLSRDAYAKLLQTSAALESITCPPPGDAVAASALKADLARATPSLDTQAQGISWQRRVWQCSAAQ